MMAWQATIWYEGLALILVTSENSEGVADLKVVIGMGAKYLAEMGIDSKIRLSLYFRRWRNERAEAKQETRLGACVFVAVWASAYSRHYNKSVDFCWQKYLHQFGMRRACDSGWVGCVWGEGSTRWGEDLRTRIGFKGWHRRNIVATRTGSHAQNESRGRRRKKLRKSQKRQRGLALDVASPSVITAIVVVRSSPIM